MPGLLVVTALLLLWALVAGRLQEWSVTAPIAMTVAGFLLTAGSSPLVPVRLDARRTEAAVEMLLAVLLFVDATEGPGGVLGPDRRLTLRLVLIALPLGLAVAIGAGYLIFPGHGFWLLAVLATVVVPIDLAPAAAVVRERRIPKRLRDLVNVESGLNDGIVAPLFLVALAAAPTDGSGTLPVAGLLDAVPAIVIAIAVGALAGWGAGRALLFAWRREWTEPVTLRIATAAVPLMVYAAANVLHGNGFVAAFVAGAFFIPAARALPEGTMTLVEDLGVLLSLLLWLLFGALVRSAVTGTATLSVVVYALVALTVVRILPVGVALLRTDLSLPDRAFLGWFGPRGVASIVFGFLAFVELAPGDADLVADVMVATVAASVVAHGATLLPIARAYARRDRHADARTPPA